MKIVFGGVTLADLAAGYPPCGVKINGTIAYEAVQLVMALRQRVFARGNELIELQFYTSREFASLRLAQKFSLSQWGALPKKGNCVVTVGEGEDTEELTAVGAVLTALAPEAQGVRVVSQYTIVAPGFDPGTPLDLLEGADTMIASGKVSIPSGAQSVTVAFDTPFAAAPYVTASVTKPGAGGDNIWPTLREDLLDSAGFTAELSGPTPASGYNLIWQAIL